jgi:hypothetical protein
MTKPFLITGLGRSGTGWASAIMTALGYPCGHEAVFGPNGPGRFVQPDSSWLAVPHASAVHEVLGVPVIRMIRDPYEVAASAYARGFLADLDDPYAAYAIKHCSMISEASDHLGRVLRWVGFWDWTLDTVPHMDVMLNSPDVRGMALYATGTEPTPGEVSQARRLVGSRVNANAHTPKARPSRAHIDDHYDGHLIRSRAERFGYR